MTTQFTLDSKKAYTFPQAFAVCAYDIGAGKLPEHTDGMVRKALQNRGILDDDKRLTHSGALLVGHIRATIAESAVNMQGDVGVVEIGVPPGAIEGMAATLLIKGGFAAWGATREGSKELRINARAFKMMAQTADSDGNLPPSDPRHPIHATGLVSDVTVASPDSEDIAGGYPPASDEQTPPEAPEPADEPPAAMEEPSRSAGGSRSERKNRKRREQEAALRAQAEEQGE